MVYTSSKSLQRKPAKSGVPVPSLKVAVNRQLRGHALAPRLIAIQRLKTPGWVQILPLWPWTNILTVPGLS